MTARLPEINEIDDAQRAIGAVNFPRLVIFTDTINRYVDTRFKGKVNLLRFTALLWLARRGGSITPSELAAVMLRSNHSMTRLVDSLEKDGLVIRDRSDEGRRTVNVKITSDGLALMEQTQKELNFGDKELMSCLDDNQLETLNNLIRILRVRLIETTRKRMNAWAYYMRGITYRRLDKKAEAVADLEKCIKLSRNSSLIEAAKRELQELRGPA